MSRALFPAEPGEISVLHALFYLRSGGGVEKMIGTINSAQETRIGRGSQQLSLRLARPCSATGSGSAARSPASTTPTTPSSSTTTAALVTAGE